MKSFETIFDFSKDFFFDFLQDYSHDLRSPLNSLGLFLNSEKPSLELKAIAQESLDRIRSNDRKIAEITSAYFSSPEEFKFELFATEISRLFSKPARMKKSNAVLKANFPGLLSGLHKLVLNIDQLDFQAMEISCKSRHSITLDLHNPKNTKGLSRLQEPGNELLLLAFKLFALGFKTKLKWIQNKNYLRLEIFSKD